MCCLLIGSSNHCPQKRVGKGIDALTILHKFHDNACNFLIKVLSVLRGSSYVKNATAQMPQSITQCNYNTIISLLYSVSLLKAYFIDLVPWSHKPDVGLVCLNGGFWSAAAYGDATSSK